LNGQTLTGVKIFGAVASALAALIVLVGCVSGTNNSTSTKTAPPSYGDVAYAKQVQDAVLGRLMTADYHSPATFGEMCQKPVVWACAIGNIESESSGSVKVILAPEDGWVSRWDGPENGLYEISGRIALNVYNFARAGGVTSLHQVNVYKADGDLAYLSPTSW
jgi:hypothetical protein